MSIDFKLVGQNVLDNSADAAVFFVTETKTLVKDFAEVSKNYVPNLKTIFGDTKFTGQKNKVVIAPVSLSNKNKIKYFIFAGLGKRKLTLEDYRRATARVIRSCSSYNIKSLVFSIPKASLFKTSLDKLVQESVIISQMTDYVFDKFISNSKKNNLEILLSIANHSKFKKDLASAIKTGEAVNRARNWIDSPPNILRPKDLASDAKEIAKKSGLKCTVFGEQEIIKKGMGGLAAVSSGSDNDCKFVILEYKAKSAKAPTLGFIGKGITFDSGGLSLKPANSMETMKEDMSGAAAVISAMGLLAELKPKVNIVMIAAISENLPSGSAAKPGDIIKFYNGKTAEIKNTDAEGRLVLADALSYAVKNYKLDAIIDLATLTGACQYSLGPFFTGLLSEHDSFTNKVKKAGEESGNFVWQLPLTDDYKVAVKSSVADLSNIGKRQYMAGATTAACFLQPFVGDTPWVHLDIAGTAFNVPDLPYYRPDTATGVGVRLLTELALNWK